MGIIKRQAFQSSIFLYAGVLIGFISTGLLAPNLLEKTEIGTLKLLQSYASVFMSLGVLGFSTITVRFLPHFYDKVKNRHNGFLGISLIIGTIGSVLASMIILGIKPSIILSNTEKSPQFAQYFILIIPLTVFQIYYILFDSYNSALYRSSYGIFLRDFVQRILVLGGLLLVLFHVFDFDQYIYFYISAICLPTILLLIHLVRHNGLDININFNLLKRDLLNSMASVGLFGLMNSFGVFAVLQIDTIMLNMYLDSDAVGIYAITFYFGTLVLMPAKALNKIAPTLIAKAFKDKDLDTIKDIYYKSSGNLFLIGVLLFLGLAVNLDNVFEIIPETYLSGKYVILIIGFANLVKMAGGSNDSIITFSQHYKMTTIFLGLLVLLIICLNVVLIPAYGMNGAAIASFLSILVYNLTKFIFIKIKFGFNPYNFQYIAALVMAVFIYFAVSWLPEIDFYILEILVDSLCATILFYLLIKFLPMADEANQFAHQIIRMGVEFFRPKIKR